MTKENTRKLDATRNTETWNRAATKGALVWGTVYSTATSGAACVLAPVVSGSTPAFSDVFLSSLVIFPSAGAAHGLIMWKARKAVRTTEKEAEELFLSPKTKPHRRPWRIHRKAA